jgi:hypothetical protein
LLPVLCCHAQFVEHLLYMGNFLFRNTAIGFRNFAHQGKNCAQKYRFALGAAHGINAAYAVAEGTVNKAAKEKSGYSAKETEIIKAEKYGNDFKQDNS